MGEGKFAQLSAASHTAPLMCRGGLRVKHDLILKQYRVRFRINHASHQACWGADSSMSFRIMSKIPQISLISDGGWRVESKAANESGLSVENP